MTMEHSTRENRLSWGSMEKQVFELRTYPGLQVRAARQGMKDI